VHKPFCRTLRRNPRLRERHPADSALPDPTAPARTWVPRYVARSNQPTCRLTDDANRSRPRLAHIRVATQPQAARSASPPPEALIAELEAMGFARPQIIAALQNTDNNASRAVDLLLAQQQ